MDSHQAVTEHGLGGGNEGAGDCENVSHFRMRESVCAWERPKLNLHLATF